MNDLYEKYAAQALVDEANKYTGLRSVPAGSYTYQIDEVAVETGDNPLIESLVGREYAHVGGAIMNGDGTPRGRQWVDVSWEERRREDKLDRESRLYGQLEKAVSTKDEPQISVGEVLDRAKAGPVILRLSEGFRLPAATGDGYAWVYPVKEAKKATDMTREQCIETRDLALKAGHSEEELKTRNFPQSIGRVRG